MEFRVLGRLVVRVGDREVALGGPLRRAVLATLLLEPDTMVPTDRLVRVMYGEEPPPTAVEQVRQAVYHLRKALTTADAGPRIVTEKPGYRLRLAPDDVLDLDRFDADVARARRARAEGDLEGAARDFRAALAWWRGDTLADLAELPVAALAVPVDQRRLTALDERIEVDLARGRHADLVPELADLVERYPLHERTWGHLMRALYRSGRRADALETYRRARAVVVEAHGLDPAPELADLHRRILADDPGLAPTVLPLGARPAAAPPPCPYRALEPYGRDDRHVFFGRRAQVDELVARVRDGESVTLVGPSGSGKSSLVLAGVLPALEGCVPVVLRPSDGADPWAALAAALGAAAPADGPPVTGEELAAGGLDGAVDRVLAHAGADRLVVVLDQAEELLVQDDAVVDGFVRALHAPSSTRTVLATLRADLLGPVLEREALAAALGRSVVMLGAMGPDQLREAITGPLAALPGVSFQDGLVDRIVADVGTEPGGLALLGLTLTLLWDEQVDGVLTHQAYDDLGRVGGALADHAETEWRRHDLAADEATARRLFGDLVRVGDDDTITRRVVVRNELDDAAWRLAMRLSATRLLVVSRNGAEEQTVELAHEALVDHWPRLRGWVEGDVEFHRWRETLRSDLARWERAGHDPAQLVRGAALREGRRWRAERPTDLAPTEVAFLTRSERHERAAGHRSRALRAALAVVAVLALVLGGVYAYQRSDAAQAAVAAGSRDLAARSDAVADRDPAYGALLAVAAWDAAPTEQARAALLARYRDAAGLRRLYSGPTGISRVLMSTDGTAVAAMGDGDLVTAWVETPGGASRTFTARADNPYAVDLALDGRALWFVADDRLTGLDLATGQPRVVAELVPSVYQGVAVSPDGTRVQLREPGQLREWDTATGRQTASAPLADPPVESRAGPPGTAVLTRWNAAANTQDLERLDLATGASTRLASGQTVTVAQDGTAAVTCSSDGATASFALVPLSGDAAAAPRPVATNVGGGCFGFTLDPTGTTMVTQTFVPATLTVVDLVSGATVRRIATPWLVRGGTRVAALGRAGAGQRLTVYDLTRVAVVDVDNPEVALPGLTPGILLPDGAAVAGVSDDGRTLRVTPLRPGAGSASVDRPAPFRPAGPLDLVGRAEPALLADRVADDRVALHRLPGLELLGVVTLPSPALRAMFIDPDGRLVTLVDGALDRWDAGTGARLEHLDLAGLGLGPRVDRLQLATLPDPHRVAVYAQDRPDVAIVDIATRRVVDTLSVGPDLVFVAFQDAHLLVFRSDETVELWNTATRQREFGPLPGQGGYQRQADFLNAPGQFLVTDGGLGVGRTLRLYDVGRPDPLAVLDLGDADPIWGLSADGTTLAFRDGDFRFTGVLRLDPAVWRAQLCAALGGRDLTPDERADLPSAPDGPVCA